MRHNFYLTNLTFSLFLVIFIPSLSPAQEGAGTLQNILDSNAKVVPFAPGTIDTRYEEGAISFSSDNTRAWFVSGSIYSTICSTTYNKGKWERPEVVSFSGRKWHDFDPFISPDGSKLFFVSTRPLPGMALNEVYNHADLWYVENTGGDHWGAPKHLDTMINNGRSNDYGPSVSSKGTLFWCSRDRDGNKGMQSYYSLWLGDHYGNPQLLTISGVTQIQDPFISPNEKYLVFLSGQSLYVSFRQQDGWSAAQKLGSPVSKDDYINSPFVSSDGKWLYFVGSRWKGFYDRPDGDHPLNYKDLEKEMDGIFNGSGNILMVPVNLPDGR